MAWKFFNKAGQRKVANYNSAATPVPSFAKTEAGMIALWFRGNIPDGWLECDGSSYATPLYPSLFETIRYTYGGSGGTFNVPQLWDSAPLGHTVGAQNGTSGTGYIQGGTAISAQAVGTTGGTTDVYLSAAESAIRAHNHSVSEAQHRHSINDPGHTHKTILSTVTINYTDGLDGLASITYDPGGNIPSTGLGGTATSPSVDRTDASGYFSIQPAERYNASDQIIGDDAPTSHTNLQPFINMIYIIKT